MVSTNKHTDRTSYERAAVLQWFPQRHVICKYWLFKAIILCEYVVPVIFESPLDKILWSINFVPLGVDSFFRCPD